MKTVIINGSPKKKLSVSSYFADISGLLLRDEIVKEKLRNKGDHKRILDEVRGADVVLFCVPLYVDGVPSHVLSFMKEMEQVCGEYNLKLKIYVISNGGFIEGNQNRPLMQVFENFCFRCGCEWGGGVGIGGGVMLNVMRIMFWVYLGSLILNVAVSGMQDGIWFQADVILNFAEQMLILLFFNIGVFFYILRLCFGINRKRVAGEKYTRAMVPSFLFILIADVFFTIISIFNGGIFRGWMSKKKKTV